MTAPYWIVIATALTREARHYQRLTGTPKSLLRKVSGMSRTTERRFDCQDEAISYALEQGLAGATVESSVVERPGTPRKRVRIVSRRRGGGS